MYDLEDLVLRVALHCIFLIQVVLFELISLGSIGIKTIFWLILWFDSLVVVYWCWDWCSPSLTLWFMFIVGCVSKPFVVVVWLHSIVLAHKTSHKCTIFPFGLVNVFSQIWVKFQGYLDNLRLSICKKCYFLGWHGIILVTYIRFSPFDNLVIIDADFTMSEYFIVAYKDSSAPFD